MDCLSSELASWGGCRPLARGRPLGWRPRGGAVEHRDRAVEGPKHDLRDVARLLLSFVAAMFERALEQHAGALFEMGHGRLDQRLVPDHDGMELAAFLRLAGAVLPGVSRGNR